MQFKYPELLYALFLLLIPIIVHLFQLRKFEKIPFSNVDFLKKVAIQTRKSSQLKKILILLSRLFLLAALIFAFAQPFLNKNKINIKQKTILYLDNSLSMQAKDGTNELFKKAVQDVINNFSNSENIAVVTNKEFYEALKGKELKNKLLSFNYYPITTDINTILLKIKDHLSKQTTTENNVVLISDFQNAAHLKLDSLTQYYLVQLTPQIKENISIDSVFIAKQSAQEITIKVKLKSYNAAKENLPISLFKEHILIGKTTVSVEKNKTATAVFNFPFNDNFNGKISINDNLFSFDNILYFSLNKPEKINVLCIGKTNNFLSKIYTNEFNFISKKVNQLDYNTIKEQHLIVLNELEKIPNSLQQALKNFVISGGSLVVIPAAEINLLDYNSFFGSINIGNIKAKEIHENKITIINFSHPILSNVFEKQIKNFQYPKVKSSYKANFKNSSSILKFENQQAFISQVNIKKGKLFYSAAALNSKNSNFKNSPLIVPVFYNFGKQSFKLTNLYYTIGKPNTFEIKTTIKRDAVLKIKNKKFDFIPLQSVSNNKVKITTEENPLKANHYQVFKNEIKLKNIAFNYDRKESETNYTNVKEQLANYKNVNFTTNINDAVSKIKTKYQTKSIWKWFVGLAILFLVIEMLLIKFLNVWHSK